MLKVAMITRSTLFTIKGGDTVQVMQTAKQLAASGVQVDIKLTGEGFDYAAYDLLHFFNIIRPSDMLCHVRRSRKPYVVSTILIDYSEYDKYHRKGWAGPLFRYLSAERIEYLKTVTRWVLGRDRLMSVDYLWKGQRRSMLQLLKGASWLLPNSESEYQRLVQRYPCSTRYRKVPNGIDHILFEKDDSVEKDPFLVICVARIEGIKNQLALIKALNGTPFRLLLIGSPAPNQPSYYRACREAAGDNIQFIGQVTQEALRSYYLRAKVHVLPSWFETTGLSSLEAAAMGCHIVVTGKGDTREYFGPQAFYCDPGIPASIYDAVVQASSATANPALYKKILDNYTWKHAAAATLSAYREIIPGS